MLYITNCENPEKQAENNTEQLKVKFNYLKFDGENWKRKIKRIRKEMRKKEKITKMLETQTWILEEG